MQHNTIIEDNDSVIRACSGYDKSLQNSMKELLIGVSKSYEKNLDVDLKF